MRAVLVLSTLLLWGVGVPALAAVQQQWMAERQPRSWTVHMDNDLFAFADEDRDYTAGVALSLGGEAAARHPLSLARALEWANDRTRFRALEDAGEPAGRSLDIGLLLFSPQDLSASEPLPDDRPYASLAYVASSKVVHDPTRETAFQSTLTLGVVGLPLAETVHRGVHRAIGSSEPMGYSHQISDGGEPTFRYAVRRQHLLPVGSLRGRPFNVRYGLGASVGYVTEASAEIALRLGGARLPWWSAPPGFSEYAGQPAVAAGTLASSGRREFILDAGLRLRARAYNSFLQGQFRDSDVEYSSARLSRGLFEAWVGVTTVLKNGVSVSYTVRRQTDEIENGSGSRDFTWASIGVTQQF
jgi:hypothetical protein